MIGRPGVGIRGCLRELLTQKSGGFLTTKSPELDESLTNCVLRRRILGSVSRRRYFTGYLKSDSNRFGSFGIMGHLKSLTV